jgi:hypothetical protein
MSKKYDEAKMVNKFVLIKFCLENRNCTCFVDRVVK